MKHWYLYALSHNKKVFYIGITTNLEQRYKYHCNFPYELTHNHIHWIKESGELPLIDILGCFRCQFDAANAENAAIKLCIVMGNKLCNDDRNEKHNKIISCTPYPLATPKKRLKRNYAKPIVMAAKERFFKQ